MEIMAVINQVITQAWTNVQAEILVEWDQVLHQDLFHHQPQDHLLQVILQVDIVVVHAQAECMVVQVVAWDQVEDNTTHLLLMQTVD